MGLLEFYAPHVESFGLEAGVVALHIKPALGTLASHTKFGD